MENRQNRFLTGAISVIRRCSVLLLALLSCTLFLLPAAAAQIETAFPGEKIDPDRKGSLRIVMKDGDDHPVSGGMAQLYCAAKVTETDGTQTLAMTAPFSGWSGDAEQLLSDQTSAESLAAFVKQNDTSCDASAAVNDGVVVFTDLAPGAYLIMQDTAAPGYEAISPFLAFLPQTSDAGLVYDIEAQPKPVKIISPGNVEILAQKQVGVVSGSAPQDTLFSFVLTAESPEAPLPKNSSAAYGSGNRSMTVSRKGAGAVNFGTLQFTRDDAGAVYTYTLREVKGTAAHYTYDTNVYKLTIRVDANENGKTLSVSTEYTDASGRKAAAAVFRNVYDAAGNTPRLPHTGQLWWPVFALAPSGVLLIVIGVIHFRRGKREEAEDAA